MLVLVKCYDNKMDKATPHLFHPFVDPALGGLKKTNPIYNVIQWTSKYWTFLIRFHPKA